MGGPVAGKAAQGAGADQPALRLNQQGALRRRPTSRSEATAGRMPAPTLGKRTRCKQTASEASSHLRLPGGEATTGGGHGKGRTQPRTTACSRPAPTPGATTQRPIRAAGRSRHGSLPVGGPRTTARWGPPTDRCLSELEGSTLLPCCGARCTRLLFPGAVGRPTVAPCPRGPSYAHGRLLGRPVPRGFFSPVSSRRSVFAQSARPSSHLFHGTAAGSPTSKVSKGAANWQPSGSSWSKAK